MIKTMTNFIPIYKYAQKNNVSVQNLYRWIRESKIKKEDVKIVEVSVKRLKINENAVIPKVKS